MIFVEGISQELHCDHCGISLAALPKSAFDFATFAAAFVLEHLLLHFKKENNGVS